MQNLLPYKAEVYFYPKLFSADAQHYYFQLLEETPWKQMPIKIFGREVMQPRLTAWYGDRSYAYSGLKLDPLPWTVSLLEVKQKVEQISKCTFNSALLNLYRDGKDSMGWHRDNEKNLGKDPVIASVSFGATRKFQLRDYATKSDLITLQLSNGSLLIMSGETQQYWEHAVPKTSVQLPPRINITFRHVH